MPKHTLHQVLGGLERMRERRSRGKLWVAVFKHGNRFAGSTERSAPTPKTGTPGYRRSTGARGRRKKAGS